MHQMQQFIIAATLVLLFSPSSAGSTSPSSTVPAFPLAGGGNRSSTSSGCQLDLSSEMFGGVQEACGHGPNLDRSRCCPVLAAWLFAAHARSALQLSPSSPSPLPETAGDSLPMMPETQSQQCADALQSSLAARDISFPRPNATCDAVLCFCGIRLHEMGSLSCPEAFNVSGDGGRVRPAAGVRALERDCRNASYSGCTRCLGSLEKLKGGSGGGGGETRMERMMDKDCRLMGLTWLLARNKSAYIPTVSAVLRATLYSAQPPTPPYRCSPDQENMPLAADSVQFQRAAAASGQTGSVSRFTPAILMYYFLSSFGVAVHVGL